MESEVIEISINENEGIIELLRRMFELKNKENKDVIADFAGDRLTTEGCNNIEDLLVKNSNVVFGFIDKDKELLIQSSYMQEVIEDFKDRGVDEFDTQEEANQSEINEAEFDKKVRELDNLDSSKSINVYNWLDSIVKYVNDIELYIPLDKVDYQYGSMANYIVKKLEEKGYTNQTNSVNNLDDYYRKLVSYQLDDLSKYGFFAYDYADNYRNEIEAQKVEQEKLVELQEEKKIISRNLAVVSDYEKGLFDSKKEKTESFDERKRKIQERIQELELIASDNEKEIDINSEFLKAEEKLKLLAMRTGKDQIKAMNFYDAASGVPFTNNIIPAFEQAAQLSDDDELKQPLIDALLKMDARYASFKDDNDTKLVQDTLERLGIKPLANNSMVNDEILKLKEEIEAIDREQSERIEKQKPIKEKLYNQLDEINDKMTKKSIEEVNNELGNNTKNENYESFMDKLAHIAAEGPIFVDLERRLDKEDQWMELNTAISLNKLDQKEEISENIEEKVEANIEEIETNIEPIIQEDPVLENEEVADVEMSTVDNNEVNEELVEETVDNVDYADVLESEEDSLVPKEDSLTIPHPIKAIKKASINLIQKVRGFEFNKIVKNALDWIKEHKKVSLAVATGLMLGAGLLLNSKLEDAQELKAVTDSTIESNQDDLQQSQSVSVEDDVIQSSNDEVVSETIVNTQNDVSEQSMNGNEPQSTIPEQTDTEISQEVIQDTLNDILAGDKVYATATDAINDVNALSTTESHRNNSWANSEAGAFYDNNADVLTREEAEQKIAAGEQVVVRYDNNGVPIGYAVGQLSNDDVSGLSR